MPTITLTLDIDILNYNEVVRNNGGLAADLFQKTKLGKNFTRSKVDQQVVKQIKEQLGKQVCSNLKESLQEKGVLAEVGFSYKE